MKNINFLFKSILAITAVASGLNSVNALSIDKRFGEVHSGEIHYISARIRVLRLKEYPAEYTDLYKASDCFFRFKAVEPRVIDNLYEYDAVLIDKFAQSDFVIEHEDLENSDEWKKFEMSGAPQQYSRMFYVRPEIIEIIKKARSGNNPDPMFAQSMENLFWSAFPYHKWKI